MRTIIAFALLLLASCAHTQTRTECTPDPHLENTPIACGDVEPGGMRMCGFLEGNCVQYLIRRTCGDHWQWFTEKCEGEESL